MSLFAKWFGGSAKKNAVAVASNSAPNSVFVESLRSVQNESASPTRSAVTPFAAETAAPRPGERSARREMVYSSVRESMVRSGILSAGYKFKVLALDKRATQFIVMVDLAEQYNESHDKLGQIEALIAYTAKSRFELLVTSVYWRLNSQLGAHTASPAPAFDTVLPTYTTNKPLVGAARARAAAAPLVAAVPVPAVAMSGIDVVEADEIEAFKRALLEAAERPTPPLDAPPPAAVAARPQTAPLVPPRPAPSAATGRRAHPPAPAETNFGGLSTTQYGDLN